MKQEQGNKVSGVLLIDKPRGLTSHDVVAKIRKIVGMQEVGHTGTLDKAATGLLIICIGKALRVAQYFESLDKEYEVEVKLGVATDTDEVDGNIIAQKDFSALKAGEVELALESLKGEILQKPPLYSAIKIDGVTLSRRTRRGEKVDAPARRVSIKEISNLKIDMPYVSFAVRCSKGTYIRALARDLGQAIGVGGAVASLRRSSVGEFSVKNAVKLEEAALDKISGRLLPMAQALEFLQEAKIEKTSVGDIFNGKPVKAELVKLSLPITNSVRITCDEKLLGIGEIVENILQPRKVLIDNVDRFC